MGEGGYSWYTVLSLCSSFSSHFSPPPVCTLCGPQFLQEYLSPPAWHSPQASVWISALAWSLLRAAGEYLLCHGETSAPALTLVFPLLFLSIFVRFSSSCVVFSALSYTHFPRSVPPMADGLSCLLWWGCCRGGWNWLSSTGRLLLSSHRGHPCSPPTSKPCHLHQYTW